MTGCNVGAKNTLVTNYLPLAKTHGAHIFVRTEVDWVEKLPGGSWRVHGRRIGRWGTRTPFTVDADNVVLSAGALGTTEILLRSQANGLSVSHRLGASFSGNGDFLGIGYNADSQTNVLGFGNAPSSPWRANAPGPSLLGGIRYHADRPVSERFIVEDTAIPSALLKEVMFFFDALPGVDTDAGDTFRESLRRNLNRVDPPYHQHNALNHTMMYLVMAHERGDGRIRLDDHGRARVEPSGAGRQEIFETLNRELYEHARANGARFISNPVWQFLDLKSLITVHPSGGCAMGDHTDDGVVDEFGQVFAVDGAMQPGLRVADASVFSTSLGMNPLLTIAALSERIADHMTTGRT